MSLNQDEKRSSSRNRVMPYDFVAVKDAEFSHLSYKMRGNCTGTLKIKMEVKTPLIAILEKKNNGLMGNPQEIPGSSLKGMLRNAVEIIWNGRLTFLLEAHKKDNCIPNSWKMENATIEDHCSTAHLFGFVATGTAGEKESQNIGEEKDQEHLLTAMASRLKVTNAKVIKNPSYQIVNIFFKPHTLSSPGGKGQTVLHCKWYVENGRAIGRKVYLAGRLDKMKSSISVEGRGNQLAKEFFYGQDTDRDNGGRMNGKGTKEICVLPGSSYFFYIHFESLTRIELADLIRIIELQDNAYHALGKGKPLGFGRVQLTVEGVHLKNSDYILDLNQVPNFSLEEKNKLLKEPQHFFNNDDFNYYCDMMNAMKIEQRWIKAYSTPVNASTPYRKLIRAQKRQEESL